MSDTRTTHGRGWAYAGALLGGMVSIAANVAHSYVPPTGAAPGWRPPLGDVVGAVFWPTALFFAIEILARTAWPTGARWVVVRLLGLLPVAVVAAIVSYGHLSGLLTHYGESALTARLGPLAVDGLMVMASSALMATAPRQRSEATAEEPEAEPVLEEPVAPAAQQAPAIALPSEPMTKKAQVKEFLTAHPFLASLNSTELYAKLAEICSTAKVDGPSYSTVYRAWSEKPQVP